MDIDALELQRMKGLGLVHHILKCHRIGHKFVTDDGLFLISRVIRPEMTASTEGQVLGELVVPFDLGCPFVGRATQGFGHDPFRQVRCREGERTKVGAYHSGQPVHSRWALLHGCPSEACSARRPCQYS
jgi:hypothetical protein